MAENVTAAGKLLGFLPRLTKLCYPVTFLEIFEFTIPNWKAPSVEKRSGTLLLFAPVPLFEENGTIYIEKQAVRGLVQWTSNFDHVKVIMPLWRGPRLQGWIPLAEAGDVLNRIELCPVPEAFRPDQFFRQLRPVQRQIAGWIAQSDYLSFAIGGLFGDWGLVACNEAHKLGREHAVWTDRVESQVVWRTRNEGSWRRRLKAWLTVLPMAFFEKRTIRRASLGLFHGRETFEIYKKYSRNPQLVHDILYSAADHIPQTEMDSKIEGAATGPLQLIYTGRADEMKGPLDWVEVLAGLKQKGAHFQATWLGEGHQMKMMQERIAEHGLSDCIHTPGYVSDRQEILVALRDAQLFLFCHKTPESPRCLIEALISGTPIVGYGSPYAEDLVANHKGGKFVGIGQIAELSELVTGLDRDRSALVDLMRRAQRDGEPFDDESVYRHRCDLIKAHL